MELAWRSGSMKLQAVLLAAAALQLAAIAPQLRISELPKLSSILVVYSTLNPDPSGNEADRQAAFMIANALREMGARAEVKGCSEVGLEELSAHSIIVVGGPASNRVAADVNSSLPLPFHLGYYVDWWWALRGSSPGFGTLQLMSSPYSSGRVLLLVAGVCREGTRAAAELLVEHIRELGCRLCVVEGSQAIALFTTPVICIDFPAFYEVAGRRLRIAGAMALNQTPPLAIVVVNTWLSGAGMGGAGSAYPVYSTPWCVEEVRLNSASREQAEIEVGGVKARVKPGEEASLKLGYRGSWLNQSVQLLYREKAVVKHLGYVTVVEAANSRWEYSAPVAVISVDIIREMYYARYIPPPPPQPPTSP